MRYSLDSLTALLCCTLTPPELRVHSAVTWPQHAAKAARTSLPSQHEHQFGISSGVPPHIKPFLRKLIPRWPQELTHEAILRLQDLQYAAILWVLDQKLWDGQAGEGVAGCN
jgi:hypothetical protein